MELAPLGIVLAFAFLCESLTEYLFADLLAAFGLDARYLKYVASVVGVALCLAYNIDALSDLGLGPRLPYVGQVLTGIMLGRGANYVHDFYTRFTQQRKPG